MLVSFRQTYGDNRRSLYDILGRDEKLLELYNLCDVNIQSFHNCSKETIDYFKKTVKVKNPLYLEFNDIHYGDCIRIVKEKLKELGTTHFLWTQDDSFSDSNDSIDWNELIEYVRDYKENFMLNLAHPIDRADNRITVSKVFNTFGVYEISTKTFADNGVTFVMDDSPYFCTIDILDKIYNEEYLKIDNVWDAELFLNEYCKKNEIPRFLIGKEFNDNIFRNYNILGRTIGKREQNLKRLIEKKLCT